MKKIILLIMLLLSFSSCSMIPSKSLDESGKIESAVPVETPSSGQDNAQGSASSSSFQTQKDEEWTIFQSTIYLPSPMYESFAAKDTAFDAMDEFLYNSLLEKNPASTRRDYLIIPTLRILDQWKEDEASYYLCCVESYTFLGVAAQIRNRAVNMETTNYYSDREIIRFRIEHLLDGQGSTQASNGYCITQKLKPFDYNDNGRGLKELCAGRPIEQHLLDWYFQRTKMSDVPYLRSILPEEYTDNPRALLQRYLESYFPGCLI